jgi:hypothetical protein
MPDKPSEPPAVLLGRSFGAEADGAGHSVVAVPAASRRWLILIVRRLAHV